MNATQKEQIRLLRLQRIGYSKIAQSLSLSENTVKSYCKRNNLGGVAAAPLNSDTAELRFCKNCGNPLLQKKGSKPKKFCCNECRTAWWNSHLDTVNKKAVYSLVCIHCGRAFESYGNKSRRFCCHPCYVAERFGKAQSQKVRD
jgi:hypothetical protein